MFGLSKGAMKDVAERVVRTFAAAFLGVYSPVLLGAGTLGELGDLSTADKALTAGIIALVTLVMGLVGTQAGSSKENASVL